VRNAVLPALLAASLVVLLIAASIPAASAAPSAPKRFEVLQAAYYRFSQAGPTNQSADSRAVLFEHLIGSPGEVTRHSLDGADALLANQSRSRLVYVQYHASGMTPPDPLAPLLGGDRFSSYYQAERAPYAIFDGLIRDFSAGANAQDRYESAFNSRLPLAPAAAINVSGAVVIQNGFVDVQAWTEAPINGTNVFVRVAVVEDNVSSPSHGRVLHHVLRAFLGGAPLVGGPRAEATQRFNFSVANDWVESQLGAVVFVQYDGPTEGPTAAETDTVPDFWGRYLLPIASLTTSFVGLALIAYFSRAKQRGARK
jgi:hypothetical protein